MEGIWKEAGVIVALLRYHPGIFLKLHKNPTCLVTRLWYEQSAVQIQAVAIFFVSFKTSGSALGPIQPQNRWTPVFFPRGSSGWGVKLTPCLRLVLRVKNEWNCTSSTLCAFVMMPDCWLEVSIRKVLRQATSTQVFLGFPVSISKR